MIWVAIPYRGSTESIENNMLKKNKNNMWALTKQHFVWCGYFWDISQPSTTTANARACEAREPHTPAGRKREDLTYEKLETRTPAGSFRSNIDFVARVRTKNDCFAVKKSASLLSI